jgi:hypothetical protein
MSESLARPFSRNAPRKALAEPALETFDGSGRSSVMEKHWQCVLCSAQRVSHAQARHERTACTGQQALVAVARTQHLPAEAPSRAAHPHST